MKSSSALKQYKKLLTGLALIILISATVLYGKAGGQDDNTVSHLISEMEVALLQCRSAEKNFLIRHDRESTDSFAQGVRALEKSGAGLKSAIKHKTVLKFLDEISAQATVYTNAFQDIKGLFDPAAFGPVYDPTLSKISDEVTLLMEPVATPSAIDTTNSLVEAGRNLEYYIQRGETSFHGLIATLNLRRWEKNFQKRPNKLKNSSEFYKKKIDHEISKLRALISADELKGKAPALTGRLKSALKRYDMIFNRFVANNNAFYLKKREMVKAARSTENSIQMIKGILTPSGSRNFALISEMEIALLQGRRAEKNFFLRQNKESVDSFVQAVKALRNNANKLIPETRNQSILSLLEDIKAEANIIENAFQDITGLYDTATLGPVHDPSLAKITDQITLMAEPTVTPSSVDTTNSLIGAARNLEYFINTFPENATPMISVLQARRWEKNFQKRYDRLTAAADSKSAFYIKQVRREISKIRKWLKSISPNIKSATLRNQLNAALERYENNLLQLSRNLDAFYVKRKKMLRSAGTLDRSIQAIKEKRFGTITETNIDGLYYLSPKMPTHGQPLLDSRFRGNDAHLCDIT